MICKTTSLGPYPKRIDPNEPCGLFTPMIALAPTGFLKGRRK
jgi:hypothetical protein